MADEVQQLLNDLNVKLEEIRPQLNHIKEVYSLLEGIKKHTNASFELPDIGWLIGSSSTNQEKIPSKGTTVDLRPDRFYGMGFTDAAEEYLKMVGHAASFDAIYEALERGGIKLESGGKNAANLSLTRAVRKFVKFRSGDTESFGLVEWYPKRKKSKAEEVLDLVNGNKNGKTEEPQTQVKEEASEEK